MRNRDWYNHAVQTINRIKQLQHCSPLGMFCSPEEYIETIEDFAKLMYGVNDVSTHVCSQLNATKTSFNIFKEELFKLCDYLLEKSEENKGSDRNE